MVEKAIRIYDSQFAKSQIREHLLRLPLTDRYMRFFSTLSKESIDKYVNSINLNSLTGEAGFGIFLNIDGPRLVGFCHVAQTNDETEERCAEMAISVDADYRRRGFGRILFKRGLLHCESYNIKRVYMNCLASNTIMKKLAKEEGMKIISSFGEAIASLDIKNDNAISSFLQAVNNDSIALYDLGCKPMATQWMEFIDLLKVHK